ncbi:MAG: amino acid permease [Deltaproteobacteria bacterium]|nr:amino acid permease [Deltaproteobacteria bacterium]MBW2218757.1 amino acid permease [Deltaproteobacteria bacterium]
MISGNDENKLKKRIGFVGLLAMCVGLNIGGALFALTSKAAGLTGPSLPLAMLISSIPALLALLPYSVLTSAIPTTSATYRYAQMVSPRIAVISMLTLAICIAIGAQPLFALAVGKYLAKIVSIDPLVSGILVLAFFYLINLVGVQQTARIQIVLFFLLMSALVLYIIMGIGEIKVANFNEPFPKGFGGLIAASGLLYTFCAGGFFVVDLGGEVIQANKVFPKALLTGMIIVVVFYLLILSITVGVLNWKELEGKSLIAVAENFMGARMLAYFIVCGALVACATTINVIYSVISRGLMIVSSEGILPSWLGKVNSKWGTPHWALTIPFIISAISLVVISDLMFFGSMLNLGLIMAITVVAISGLLFPDRYPDLFAKSLIKVSPKTLKIVCWLVIMFNSLIFIFFTIAIKKASLVFFGIIVAVFIYSITKKEVLNKISGNLDFFEKE